jgi:hypothetical protein
VGDPDAPNRLHYYVEGTKEEPHVALLPYKYRTEVPLGRLYNIITDPLGLKTAAKRPGMVVADPNLAEQMMAEAGYVGYLGTSKDTVAAAIFEPLKVERVVKTTEMRPRSSKSVANQARAQRVEGYRAIIRRAIPTASKIIPDPKVHDIFTVILPNGAKIEVKFNAMPEGVDVLALAKELYGHRAIADDEVPLGLWVASENVTITGEGIIYIAGIGDLQADFDHEVYHAAKSIVLTKAENEQLKKDYPKGDEQEAEAYEKWRKTNASHKIFDKIRSFFRRIQEAFGLGKGKSYQIFRTINDGKVWARSFKGSDAKGGRLRAAMYSLLDEVPKFKGAIGQANEEDIMHDFRQWENLGAVLYIEGLQGREWTAEMTAQLKEHYRLDKLPQGVVKHIRKASQHVFKTRAAETLTGKLPTLEALMEMERRGAQEGGMVWYDDRDGLSMLVPNEAGELEARSAKGELEEFFGDDAEFMAGLIAHLSSGMQVPPNVQKAIEVYVAHKLGISFTGTYQVTKKQIDEFLETRQTSGPKRLPFFNAIMGDADSVVIDRWMARVLDFRTWNNKKEVWQTSTGATETQRNLLIEWVKRGAKRMGISNRAYQALIWSGKKALDEEAAGKPTGSLEPLYKVINQKLTVNGIPADQIPAGKEGEYFILPGVDRWAIPLAKFMPLQSDPLIKVKESKRPSDLVVPKAVDKPLTAKEEADLAAQQGKLFAKMGRPETAVEDSLEEIFGGTHKGILRRMIDGWKRVTLRTQLLDEFHPILKHLGERTYRLHRMLNGVHASVEALMRHGKLRLNDDGVIEADGVRRGFAV